MPLGFSIKDGGRYQARVVERQECVIAIFATSEAEAASDAYM